MLNGMSISLSISFITLIAMKTLDLKWVWPFFCALLFPTCSATDNQAVKNEIPIGNNRIDSLNTINDFFIQEDQQPLTKVSHVAFSPDGKMMSICDIGSYSCFLVSTSTGKTYDIIKSHYSMMDSVALYIKFADSSTSDRIVTMQDLIASGKKNKQQINIQQISSQLSTEFFSTIFLSNDQIIGNSLTRVLLERGQGDNVQRGVASLPTLFCYSLADKKIKNFHPYENENYNNGPSPILGNIALNYLDIIVSPYIDFFNMSKRQYDNIKAIGFFDFNGKKISTTLSLPKEYGEYQLDYNMYHLYLCEGENNHIYAMNSKIPRVFDATNNHSFEMKNMPEYANNKAYLINASSLKQDSISQYFGFISTGLYSKKSQSLMVVGYWKDEFDRFDVNKYMWFVQEYSVDGKLIGMRTLLNKSDSDKGKIQWITYSKSNNAVYVFYLSKKNGWRVVAYQWRP